jgi:hypothetical protein
MTTTGNNVIGGPDTRLATYGTLAPGRPNQGQLSESVLPASIYVLASPSNPP